MSVSPKAAATPVRGRHIARRQAANRMLRAEPQLLTWSFVHGGRAGGAGAGAAITSGEPLGACMLWRRGRRAGEDQQRGPNEHGPSLHTRSRCAWHRLWRPRLSRHRPRITYPHSSHSHCNSCLIPNASPRDFVPRAHLTATSGLKHARSALRHVQGANRRIKAPRARRWGRPKQPRLRPRSGPRSRAARPRPPCPAPRAAVPLSPRLRGHQ